MSKHTEGPWENIGVKEMEVLGRLLRITNPEGYPTAFVPAWDRPIAGQEDGADEAIANAALISAAPDMLEALKGFSMTEQMIVSGTSTHLTLRVPIEAIQKAAAAIAKATLTRKEDE